jgi:hypothetical protein
MNIDFYHYYYTETIKTIKWLTYDLNILKSNDCAYQ